MNEKRPTGQPSITGDYSTVPPLSDTASAADRQDPQEAGGGVSTLGRYRIVRKLGQGGMGAVYLAFDPTLQRQVALKVMLPRFAADSAARERFLREARAAARVRSDHVVTIYDVGEARGLPFLAMELLQGRSLGDHLGAGLEVAKIIRIGREVAEGLASAHALGLVHRDIKPANLWLEEPGDRVKILDFGLARFEDGPGPTQPGMIVGTPAYMSPEQAAGRPVDARSDLFSLGGVLYHLCTGRLPFPGDSTLAILSALATNPPPPIRAVNPAVPAPLADLIHRLLAKEPGQRPASAGEVVALFRALEARPPESTSTGAYLPQKEATTAVSLPEKRRRLPRSWPLVLAGVLGVLVVAGVTAFAFRPRPPDTRTHEGGENAEKAGPIAQPKERAKAGPSLDPEFVKTVRELRHADLQLAEIKKELLRRNPDFEGNVGPPGGLSDLMVLYMTTGKIHDLTPVLALPRLSTLAVINRGKGRGRLEDLRPVAGVKQLTHLKIVNQSVSDLSPLKGLKLLATADLSGNRVSDLSPLAGMRLLLLNCDDNPVSDLSPLQGQFISALHLKGTNVRDLQPLRPSLMRNLGHLDISDTKVEDFSPLAGSKLCALHARGVALDAAVLETLALQEVSLDYDAAKHRTALRAMKSLKRINGKPAEAFWNEVEK